MILAGKKSERGFTLPNVIFSVGVVLAVVWGMKYWQRSRDKLEKLSMVAASAERIQERFTLLMKTDNAWKSTVANGAPNATTNCLRDHSPCFVLGGPVNMKDGANRFVYDSNPPANGFTIDGHNCAGFTDKGSDNCPFRLDLTWKPVCESDCTDPSSILLQAKLRFRSDPKGEFAGIKIPDIEFSQRRSAVPGDPRNCYELLLTGKATDGLYTIQPNRSQVPFSVYCDQQTDGGGWALVASATEKYSSLPPNNAVVPGSQGRLPKENLAAYLETSNFLDKNNLRLVLPGIDGGITLGASTMGSTEVAAYSAHVPPGDCRKVNQAPNPTTSKPAPELTLEFNDAGEMGLSDMTDPAAGYYGFFVCMNSELHGKRCATGCTRSWKGALIQQKGQIWVR
ncbi:MAG TPA: fibrinogen-like YCDxxxxGGGW domain-containing protein [Bdellovibrionota bacterium]|jgi:hypothetical protein